MPTKVMLKERTVQIPYNLISAHKSERQPLAKTVAIQKREVSIESGERDCSRGKTGQTPSLGSITNLKSTVDTDLHPASASNAQQRIAYASHIRTNAAMKLKSAGGEFSTPGNRTFNTNEILDRTTNADSQ